MSKPYLTIDEQMKVLTDMKGLIVSDEKSAKEMLTDIGYFSLIGGYKRSFINPMTRKYEVPTTFEDILSLYRFDEALRQLTPFLKQEGTTGWVAAKNKMPYVVARSGPNS